MWQSKLPSRISASVHSHLASFVGDSDLPRKRSPLLSTDRLQKFRCKSEPYSLNGLSHLHRQSFWPGTLLAGAQTPAPEASRSGNRISIADLEDLIPHSVTEVLDFGLRF